MQNFYLFIYFLCPPSPQTVNVLSNWEVISSFTVKLLLKLILQNHAFRAMHTWVHFCLTWQLLSLSTIGYMQPVALSQYVKLHSVSYRIQESNQSSEQQDSREINRFTGFDKLHKNARITKVAFPRQPLAT